MSAAPEQPKRGRGRPVGTTKPDDEKAVSVPMRIAGAERRAKFQRLGRAWLEQAIDRAKEPIDSQI